MILVSTISGDIRNPVSLHVAYTEDTARDRKVPAPWFAIRVRSNYEQVTSLHLQERGYEQFAPSYEIEREWVYDRKKRAKRFLFPG